MAPRSLLGPQTPAFLGDDPWMRVPGHENAYKPKPKAKDARNWQQKVRDALNDMGRKYLGPHGDAAFGLLGTAAEFSDAADLRDAVEYGGKMGGAVQRGDWWGAAGAAPWMLAASGAAMLPGMSVGAADEIAGNGRELVDHLKDAQSQQLLPSVQGVSSHEMPKVSSSFLEDFLARNFPGYRVEHSKSISERFGPSASSYYTIDTPAGPKKIRLSDHDYMSGADVDLRYGTDAAVAEKALREKLGLAVPEDVAMRADAAMKVQAAADAEFYSQRSKAFIESRIAAIQKAKNLTPEQKQKAIARVLRRGY